MKKFIAALALLGASISTTSAATFYNAYGVIYGNVCRAGLYYTVYPLHMAQPVGSRCPVRDPYGYIIAEGRVTAE